MNFMEWISPVLGMPVPLHNGMFPKKIFTVKTGGK